MVGEDDRIRLGIIGERPLVHGIWLNIRRTLQRRGIETDYKPDSDTVKGCAELNIYGHDPKKMNDVFVDIVKYKHVKEDALGDIKNLNDNLLKKFPNRNDLKVIEFVEYDSETRTSTFKIKRRE